MSVAALYVQAGGAYWDMPGIDAWDEARDARKYAGPYPVVAHPPCQRWGKMWFGQPLTVKLTGKRKVKGDDDGCFDAALASVRKWGGVLEHPWGSHAWPHFGLNVPPREGGWVNADFLGGWTCCVEQGRYGHYARKPTLLLVYGVRLADLESLVWGKSEAKLDPAVVERMGLKRAKRLGEVGARGGGTDSSPRIAARIPRASPFHRQKRGSPEARSMNYSEAAFFDSNACQHCADRDEQQRLARKRQAAASHYRRSKVR